MERSYNSQIHQRLSLKPDQTNTFDILVLDSIFQTNKATKALKEWGRAPIIKDKVVISPDELFRRANQHIAICKSTFNCGINVLELSDNTKPAVNFAKDLMSAAILNYQAELENICYYTIALKDGDGIREKSTGPNVNITDFQETNVKVVDENNREVYIIIGGAADLQHQNVSLFVDSTVKQILKGTDIHSGKNIGPVVDFSKKAHIGDFSKTSKSALLTLGPKGVREPTSIIVRGSCLEANFDFKNHENLLIDTPKNNEGKQDETSSNK